jgi:hypothetical protein
MIGDCTILVDDPSMPCMPLLQNQTVPRIRSCIRTESVRNIYQNTPADNMHLCIKEKMISKNIIK